MSFILIAGEPSGAWGPSAIYTFKAIARAVALRTGREASAVLPEHLGSLCSVVRRANACAILRRDEGGGADVDGSIHSAALLLEAPD
jgi:hypothetical protein